VINHNQLRSLVVRFLYLCEGDVNVGHFWDRILDALISLYQPI
jgi:hypothetical protein